MPEPRMIKAVSEINCPHCSKKVLISLRSYFPSVDWALKKEDLETAKKNLKEGIEKAIFDDPKRKEEVLALIEQKEFVIGPEEVTPMIEQIIKDNNKQEQEDETESNKN